MVGAFMVACMSASILSLSTVTALIRSSFDDVPNLQQQIIIPNQFQIDRQPAVHHTRSNVSICYDDTNSVTKKLTDKSKATDNTIYSIHDFETATTGFNLDEARRRLGFSPFGIVEQAFHFEQ